MYIYYIYLYPLCSVFWLLFFFLIYIIYVYILYTLYIFLPCLCPVGGIRTLPHIFQPFLLSLLATYFFSYIHYICIYMYYIHYICIYMYYIHDIYCIKCIKEIKNCLKGTQQDLN